VMISLLLPERRVTGVLAEVEPP